MRRISSLRSPDALASFNAGPATKAAAARLHQRWARWVLPQPDGPCRTSIGAGHAGQRSIQPTAALLLSETRKSDRPRAVRREKSKAIWLTNGSRGLFGTRQNPRPAYQI